MRPTALNSLIILFLTEVLLINSIQPTKRGEANWSLTSLPFLHTTMIFHITSHPNLSFPNSLLVKMNIEPILLFHALLLLLSLRAQAKCKTGCDLAFASYNTSPRVNLTFISTLFSKSLPEILRYNPHVSNQDSILAGTRINVPFSCDCLNGDFLGHTFIYTTQTGDTYDKIANIAFANLTTEDWVHRVNIYDTTRIPDDAPINVTLNCSCGDKRVSKNYGLFATFPLQPGENSSSLATASGVSADLLQSYNPGVNFSAGSGIVYVPAKDATGNYPPLKISAAGISRKVIAGISIAGVAGALLLISCIYFGCYRRQKIETVLIPETTEDPYIQHGHGFGSSLDKTSEETTFVATLGLTGFTVDKSVEFSYEELANATNDFSMVNKIGQGGFGSVYYAELRGEKAAIKKMDMQASKEFLAELKVLTHVYHLNLVRLIGYCVEGSLFLVYEFIENGNLSQHLRGSERDPLPWLTRVQIALDSARGLEYIHEHTVPVYIHRDIKSANILIDKNFRGKVADFGLTKLTEYGSASLHTRLVGTFGYMPPEYARYGDVSPKIDVYAFGVVLYELISAKEAVVKANEIITESKGLVALFEDVLSQPDSNEDLCKLVDPRLGDNYPLDSVHKMAQLAKACTQENPQLRPSMRSIVVALMTLSSSTEDWDVGTLYENQALLNLMSGR
ncbi:lysM domain receptor-like kinase 3 isoform X1 [Ricinus communis]|uniref:lysM domain receptor-like kinase 3 isoform X1 n=1 Tax=Ricinus communis TaxID=3988 RepID=UPI0007722D3D|nr:lysM domain receptor-like kinase 3 isoform X1 [Ricinus communis]|eukprot:XP_015574289.1 lysM domain receptor-like kinase 3 isoform X1 [Ricinus communis]